MQTPPEVQVAAQAACVVRAQAPAVQQVPVGGVLLHPVVEVSVSVKVPVCELKPETRTR